MAKTEKTKALVCRHCDRVAVEVRTKDGGKAIRCPICGKSGNFNEVLQAANLYLARSVTRPEIHDFQRRQVASAKRIKNIRYRPGKLPTLIPPDFILR